MSAEIALLGRTIPVAAQPWARLARFGDKLSAAFEGETGVLRLGGEAYDLLVALAPEVGRQIPRYTWFGFTSQVEMDASPDGLGDGDGPTLPEIIGAFKVALEVNGADTLGKLGRLIDPKVRGAIVTGLVEQAAAIFSQGLPSTSGGQAPSGGPLSPPLAATNGAGPSLASVAPSPDAS